MTGTPDNLFFRIINGLYYVLDAPVTYFREKVIEPNRKHYPYYHQVYRRVPTIDECYTDDYVCRTEANEQFKRDKLVEDEIIHLLRQRSEHCVMEDPYQREEPKCAELYEIYETAAGAWFEKYGDLGPDPNVIHAFMKQKHRMAWERRHGKVGSGMKEQDKFKVDDE